MPIKGLTDQWKTALDTDPRGRPVRLGYLQKGWREGFGKSAKLHDLDHFRFKPMAEGKQGEEMTTLFEEAYGKQPRAIDDVRIPVSLAGNFNIESCASYVAMKHTPKGSIFLAESDGEFIRKARNEAGKVIFPEREFGRPWLYADYTKPDPKGNPCFVYRGKFYPWQASMAIDLILPKFNDLLYKKRLAGHGVVTFITHARNDIPTLIGEYFQIIEEIVGLFANPLDVHSVDRARRYTPLRDIPMRLFRSEDKMTSPGYGDTDPAERVLSTRWLCHWQINPEFAEAIQSARTQRTASLIAAVASSPMLSLGNGRSVADINEELGLGLPAGKPANGNGHTNGHSNGHKNGHGDREETIEQVGPDWEALSQDGLPEEEILEGEFEEQEGMAEEAAAGGDNQGESPNVEPLDWTAQALKAKTLDGFCAAVYQLNSFIFDDAGEVKRGYEFICKGFKERNNEAALQAFKSYAQIMGDTGRKGDAARTAKRKFEQLTMPVAA